MKQKKHIILLLILVIVFFSIIFISTNKNEVSVEYDFYNNINTTYETKADIIIGKVKIKNNDFLPKKVYLKDYILCNKRSETSDRSYQIYYRGIVGKDYGGFLKSSYNSKSYVEIQPGKTINLNLETSHYYNFKDINETLIFNVFEIDKTKYNTYSFCNNVKPNINQSIKQIKINIE